MPRKKVLTVVKDVCLGCRVCEMMCSLKHSGTINPGLARVRVVTNPKDHSTAPVICRQCKNAPCKAACPIPEAMYYGQDGVLLINEDKCIQCLACVYACPFGAMQVGPDRQVLKCDLCGGEPVCAKYCPTVTGGRYPKMPATTISCLQFVEAGQVSRTKG